jgi:isoaspartyl peptidase/L-asparaginase-like protein (Ntn-hydrolase superfamily)
MGILPEMRAPILVTTWPFGDAANRAAWPALAAGGASLDAVEAVCRHVEDDPAVDSVGYGGLPDRAGEVSLDALVMQSPSRLGAVCALRRTRRAVSVARLVMERSPHVLLAGHGADQFAAAHGFAAEEMLAPSARAAFVAWRASAAARDAAAMRGHDTVCCLGLDAAGVLSGASSTSGRAWKLPGRVGDSPLPGHGLYVDPERGAAAATGDGELVQGLCSSYAVVEALGRGVTPLAALLVALERVQEAYGLTAERAAAQKVELALIALAPDGRWASAALRRGYRTAVATAAGFEIADPEHVAWPES